MVGMRPAHTQPAERAGGGVARGRHGPVRGVRHSPRPFRVLERQSHLAYPAGVVDFVEDRSEGVEPELQKSAHQAYAELVKRATDRDMDEDELGDMSAYAMAATVDFGLDAKQGLLDM